MELFNLGIRSPVPDVEKCMEKTAAATLSEAHRQWKAHVTWSRELVQTGFIMQNQTYHIMNWHTYRRSNIYGQWTIKTILYFFPIYIHLAFI